VTQRISDFVFWTAIGAVTIAQIFIFRSTARGMKGSAAQRNGRTALEWMWAILPAITLAALFVWTWRTMHPPTPPDPATNVVTATVVPVGAS
jgi:heme/copper-type cytochrome/quinol oxidase subunit 2